MFSVREVLRASRRFSASGTERSWIRGCEFDTVDLVGAQVVKPNRTLPDARTCSHQAGVCRFRAPEESGVKVCCCPIICVIRHRDVDLTAAAWRSFGVGVNEAVNGRFGSVVRQRALCSRWIVPSMDDTACSNQQYHAH